VGATRAWQEVLMTKDNGKITAGDGVCGIAILIIVLGVIALPFFIVDPIEDAWWVALAAFMALFRFGILLGAGLVYHGLIRKKK
jgi:ABC-type transport system involved in multi-copper enzyme maturation permease subunit